MGTSHATRASHQRRPGRSLLQCGHCLGCSVGSLETPLSSALKVPSSGASHRHPERCVGAGAIVKPPVLLFPCQAVVPRRSTSWWWRTVTRSPWVRIALPSCRRSLTIAGRGTPPGGPLWKKSWRDCLPFVKPRVETETESLNKELEETQAKNLFFFFFFVFCLF